MSSSKSILAKIFTQYYLTAAEAKSQGKPIVYVTAFTPVEILRAMGLTCLFPESYAVVCAASQKAPDLIQTSGMRTFAQDLCSYSLIDFGRETYSKLPYGGIPEPDILVATNNQCGTTLLWFELLAQQKNIPLFVIDYPTTLDNADSLKTYVQEQYKDLITFIHDNTGAHLAPDELSRQVAYGKQACRLWAEIHALNKQPTVQIEAHKIVNALFAIVAAKGLKETCDYLEVLLEENKPLKDQTLPPQLRLLWHGYPMWFLDSKFPSQFDSQFKIVINDYTFWWALEYGNSEAPMDALAHAYSNTYLNWPLDSKLQWTKKLINEYSIDGVICHANRSCRRSLTDITPLRKMLAKKNIPSVVIESDMANPAFYSKEQIALRIESFKESLQQKNNE